MQRCSRLYSLRYRYPTIAEFSAMAVASDAWLFSFPEQGSCSGKEPSQLTLYTESDHPDAFL